MPRSAAAAVDRPDLAPARRLPAVHVGDGLWSAPPGPEAPFAPRRTEPARRASALVAALAALGDPQTVITTEARDRDLADHGGVTVVAVPTQRGELPPLRTFAASRTASSGAAVLHVHLRHTSSRRAALLVAAASRCPVVVHLHASAGVPMRTGERSSLRGRLIHAALEARLLSSAAAVVVPSERLAEVAVAAGATRVAVLPPAPLPVASPSPIPPSLGDAGRRVVSVGDLTCRRRPTTLVRALASLPEDLRLVLLGTGPGVHAVEREASHLRVVDRVHVVPAPSWQQVTDHLAAADVVATAALAGEDVAAVLLAMDLARPVVATAVEGIPSVLTDAVDGRLVRPGDQGGLTSALADVLAHPGEAATLGASARRRVRAADWASRALAVRRLCSDLHRPATVGTIA